jgi:hypothetical protein
MMRILPFVVGLTMACSGQGQSHDSASELIAFLTRPDPIEAMGMATPACSLNPDDRAAARSLIDLGPSAIPEIEETLYLMEEIGGVSETAVHSEWLLYAYAKLAGLAGFPRIRKMMGNSALSFFDSAWDSSAAISLGITSYISKFHRPPAAMTFIYNHRVVFCRDQEPRFGLDQFIAAWEQNDRLSFERSLGPHAKAALSSLLEHKTWEDWRAGFWGSSVGGGAVGFRFNVTGPWSAPPDMLEQHVAEDLVDPELETLFKGSSGSDCGTYRIKFAGDGRAFGDGSLAYQVDNPDLGSLIRMISSCAGR